MLLKFLLDVMGDLAEPSSEPNDVIKGIRDLALVGGQSVTSDRILRSVHKNTSEFLTEPTIIAKAILWLPLKVVYQNRD